jgi:hypothetical protein
MLRRKDACSCLKRIEGRPRAQLLRTLAFVRNTLDSRHDVDRPAQGRDVPKLAEHCVPGYLRGYRNL